MLQIADLGVPEAFLVLYLIFFSKVGDAQDRFVGYRALLYAELEELIIRLMVPTVDDVIIFQLIYDLSGICRAIPAKEKLVIPLIYLVCKPLLKAYRC